MPRPRALTRALLLAAATGAATLALGAGTAFAAWSLSGAGNAGGGATTMPAGNAPTGSATGTSVSLRWPAATMGNGTAVAGYVIRRYNAINGGPATVGAGCSGVVTTTTCTETNVPAGSWLYTDTPVQLTWTGSESGVSSTITVP